MEEKFYHFRTGMPGGFDVVEKERVDKVLEVLANRHLDYLDHHKVIDELYPGDDALRTIFVSWENRFKRKFQKK